MILQTKALVTAPTQDAVTLDEVKQHLRVDGTDEDDLIEAYIAAAVNLLDAAGGGYLGRALRPQVWEYRQFGFYPAPYWVTQRSPYVEIALPFPPFVSITSVKYDTVDGVETTLAVTTGYRVMGSGSLDGVRLAPPYSGAWPVARDDYESVRIRYTAGYDRADSRGDLLPKPIRQAIFLMIGDMMEHRETVVAGDRASAVQIPMSVTVEALLAPYRAFWF